MRTLAPKRVDYETHFGRLERGLKHFLQGSENLLKVERLTTIRNELKQIISTSGGLELFYFESIDTKINLKL